LGFFNITGIKRGHKLDIRIIEKISLLKKANNIVPINKGFSADQKYIIDEQYLIRMFSSEFEISRREEYHTIHALSAYSDYVPKVIEFGSLEDLSLSYMILSYLPGEDAEVSLQGLTKEEQYSAGFIAGGELKKLHSLSAPATVLPWYEQKKQKNDHYLVGFKKLPLDKGIKLMLETYIDKNEYLMKGRPNIFQHDDFHPSNLLINNRMFSGIIDFQRMDWGDPIHDLTKLGFFSSRISVPFTRGIVDGYHNNGVVGEDFWELYSLYSVMHIVSALVWGLKINREQYELLLSYSLDVIRDHDDFNRVIPKWYES